MTPAITLWLSFVLAAGCISWFGTRKQALALAVVALAVAPQSFMTLGHAAPWRPPAGQHAVLGARIDVDVAIWVLLDVPGAAPRYYRLPYTAGDANALQQAMDGAADGEGGVALEMGEDGSPGFSETHGAPMPAKK